MNEVGAPRGVDPTKPSVARVYDYALGGKDHYPVDRELFEVIRGVYPEYQRWAVANRRFMAAAVRLMAQAGVRQFLDLGTGLPTSPNVHEIAREVHPDAAVVYVDHDDVVTAHNAALLADREGLLAVSHDLTEPEGLLHHPAVRAALDFDQPIGLLLVAVLHFVPHQQALKVLARYRTALAPGSHVAISAFRRVPEARLTDSALELTEHIAARLSSDLVFRSPEELAELFEGFDMVGPGLVDVSEWRMGTGEGTGSELLSPAGVGRLARAA